MAVITARQFAANLKKISGEELKETVSACFAFALYHYHNHGQKTPYMQLQASVAESRSFMADIVKKLSLGRREKGLSEIDSERRADAAVALAFADTTTKRAIAKEQREARKAIKAEKVAPESAPETVEIEADYIIAGKGEVTVLTAEEYAAIMEALMQLRVADRLQLAA